MFGPRLRHATLVPAAVSLMCLLLGSCGPAHFSLLRAHGREWLLPPRAKAPPAGDAARDCDAPPVTPRASHYSLYGCYPQTGFSDLRPGMRLKIVRPVTKAGEALKAEVVSSEGLNLTVRTNAIGVDTRFHEYTPGAAFLDFPASLTHFRLFFRSRVSGADQEITLIGHTSTAGLDRAMEDAAAYCRATPAACLAMPRGSVIAPEIGVDVNGRQTWMALGATVREAMGSGVVPPALRMWREWKGRSVAVHYPAADRAILSLPLNAGDRLRW